MRDALLGAALALSAYNTVALWRIKRARRLRSPWKQGEKRPHDDVEKYLDS